MSDKAKSNFLEGIGLRDVQARNAFAILSAETDKLKESLDATKNATGETEAALNFTGNTANTVAEVMNKVKAIFTLAGSSELPLFSTALGIANKSLGWVIQNGGLVKDILKGIGIGAAIAGAAYVALNFATIKTAISTWALNSALLANPFTWIATAIVGVTTAIVLLWQRCEKFRGFITGLWEAVKQVFSNIWEAGKRYLGGLGELLVGIFTLDISKIKSGLSNAFGGVMDFYTGAGKGVGEKFSNGFEEGASKVRRNLNKGIDNKSETYRRVFDNTSASISGNTFSSKPDGKSAHDPAGKIDQGVGVISGGGKSVKNVTVNIQKLVENINITTSQLKEGTGEIKRMIEETILRAIQGAELVAGQ